MNTNRANLGRLAAAKTLIGVENGGHADQLLAKYAPMAPQDRRLAWHIALGVLRHLRTVDAAIRPLLKQPLASLDIEVLAALRIGAFEALFSRTKTHAVVDQSVELVKALDGGRAKGLVNAVVRKISKDLTLSRGESLNHPDWILERWDNRYDEASVDQWCTQNNEPPALYVVTLPDTETLRSTWEEQGIVSEPVRYDGRFIPNLFRVEGPVKQVTKLAGYDDGWFWVQDVASVLAADCVSASAGDTVIDACAAPGGKTIRLLSQGASVLAVDESGKRIRRLRQNLDRMKKSTEIIRHDWTKGALSDTLFDAVLVDAPCTGLGTVRRKPEIRWKRTPLDLLRLAGLQQRILNGASLQVKPGGKLVYSVCSPEPEEGTQQIKAFLEAHTDFTLDYELETAPPAGDFDAFYMARLVRQ